MTDISLTNGEETKVMPGGVTAAEVIKALFSNKVRKKTVAAKLDDVLKLRNQRQTDVALSIHVVSCERISIVQVRGERLGNPKFATVLISSDNVCKGKDEIQCNPNEDILSNPRWVTGS